MIAYQLPVPKVNLLTLARVSSQALGTAGEFYAARMFQDSGYLIEFTERGRNGDLIVCDPATGEFWRVEVKTARQNSQGNWLFCLQKPGKANHKKSDYVVLLAVLKSGRAVSFIVPVSAILNQKSVAISSHPENYSGRLAKYRQRGQMFRIDDKEIIL